ncbi:MAG: lipoate--protein ligase [Marinilabiliaceae bacterium]|nr:lipoate--protein ligase [Marinilabiliaceae bacterium]
MIGYISTTNDAAYNLATEEYLLKNRSEDIFFLYINEPSIIAGKHQNILAEINFKAAKRLNLKIFRRLSGGGTVYHDLGNINYCFILNTKEGRLINFRDHSLLIAEALEKLGLKPTVGKRNEINVNGFKVSGNASHVYKNRSLHHGTLLYSSDLNNLNECLNNNPNNYIDQAVKSVKSEVTNISEQLQINMSIHEFTLQVFQLLTNDKQKPIKLTPTEDGIISQLAENKYQKWEWNFGYSPKFIIKKRISLPKKSGELWIEITVEKGIITGIKCQSQNSFIATLLEKKLHGISHNPISIKQEIDEELMTIFNTYEIEELIDELF